MIKFAKDVKAACNTCARPRLCTSIEAENHEPVHICGDCLYTKALLLLNNEQTLEMLASNIVGNVPPSTEPDDT